MSNTKKIKSFPLTDKPAKKEPVKRPLPPLKKNQE